MYANDCPVHGTEEEKTMMYFDECVTIDVADRAKDLVIHRAPDGEVFAYHSPLGEMGKTAIRCGICEGGARVYIKGGSHE
jgi:hypothetical protein